MKKKSFTLLEIMIVVVVIGILTTLGFPVYQNVIEDAHVRLDEANLKALDTAREICMLEKRVVPACLSEIPQEYLNKAYAKVLQKAAWKIKLAYFIVDWHKRGLLGSAYAEDPPFYKLVRGNIKLITCPKDPTPPVLQSDGTIKGISYGFFSKLEGITLEDYQINIDPDTLIIADCDARTFTGLGDVAKRHKHHKILSSPEEYAMGISNIGIVKKIVKTTEGDVEEPFDRSAAINKIKEHIEKLQHKIDSGSGSEEDRKRWNKWKQNCEAKATSWGNRLKKGLKSSSDRFYKSSSQP